MIIHQELALVPYLSIAENIFLGNEHVRPGPAAQHRQLARHDDAPSHGAAVSS